MRVNLDVDWNRFLSLAVASAAIVAGTVAGRIEGMVVASGSVIVPLACIWFGEAMGDHAGGLGLPALTRRSPAVLVTIMGWVALLAVAGYVLLVAFAFG